MDGNIRVHSSLQVEHLLIQIDNVKLAEIQEQYNMVLIVTA